MTLGPSLNCDEPSFPFSTKFGFKPVSQSHCECPADVPTLARAGWMRVEHTKVQGRVDGDVVLGTRAHPQSAVGGEGLYPVWV